MPQGPGTSPSIDSSKPNLPTSAELSEQIERVMHIPREDLTRRHFYPIRRLFLQLALVEGWQATIKRAATLIEALVDHRQWEAIAADHDKTLQTLLDVSKQEPTTFLDEHIVDLAAGRLAAAIKGFGRIQTETLSNFSKYRQILEDGPERGLTVWQVMNPFYYIWSTLPVVGPKVIERWKETGFNNSFGAEAFFPVATVEE